MSHRTMVRRLAIATALSAAAGAAFGEPRPPGAIGENRCTIYRNTDTLKQDAVIYAGRRKRGFAICIDRDPAQHVVVTLDRTRWIELSGAEGRQVCEDVEARDIRVRIDQPGYISSCPAL